jgi:hypothetical protein
MRSGTIARTVLAFAAGIAAAHLLRGGQDRHPPPALAGAQARPGQKGELAALKAEIARLKEVAGDQAHAMVSVAYHFDNLWFAGKAGNWALAEFYWNETRSHLRWAVRVIPVRKDSAGQEVDLRAILQAVENTPLKDLQGAIKAKDREKFAAAYRFTLEGCYSCHKAAEKPYLRPQVPERPAESAINFDPRADWPK